MTQTPAMQEWKSALRSLIALSHTLTDSEWTTASPCPEWTVADLVAHSADLESLLADEPRPTHEPPWDILEHVSTDFGRFTEIGVDVRRSWSQDDVLRDLEGSHDRAVTHVAGLPDDATKRWLRGIELPVSTILQMRTFDAWVHEQDIRVATVHPGNESGSGAVEAWNYLTAGLPKAWSKSAQAPVGTSVTITTVEPGIGRQCRVGTGPDGRGKTWEEPETTCSIVLPWISFVMIASGRTTTENMAATAEISGDGDLAGRLLSSMAVTP